MIEEAVTARVEEILEQGGYCNKNQVRQVAEEIVEVVHREIDQEMQRISSELTKVVGMNDRLWDQIDQMKQPRHPMLRDFFKFRWLKFWRHWL